MEEPKKYSTGRPIDIPQDKVEQEKAIKEWAEGNPSLEEAIRQCIEHGIKTEASCAGHGRNDDDPYLAMEISDETIKTIYSILNNVFQNRNGIKSIDIFNDIDKAGNPRRHLAIHAKSKQKDEIFKLISEGTKSEIDLDKCSPIIQRMMELEQAANHQKTFSHGVAFYNLGPVKAVIMLNNTLKANKAIYDRAKIGHSINMCLTDSQVLSKFAAISEAFGVHPAKIDKGPGLFEKMRLSLIDRLEKDLAPSDETIDLNLLSEEDREKAFIQFGEGSRELTSFLKSAYEHGAPSIFCCSGHDVRQPYVMLKVTNENLELLQTLGKVLSKQGVVTNFEEHHQYGKRVTFSPHGNVIQKEWLDKACDIMEHPEQFDSSNPSIYYHEEMTNSYVPYSFNLKKRILERLKAVGKKQITDGSHGETEQISKVGKRHSWDLTEEEKRAANERILKKRSLHRESNPPTKDEDSFIR